MTGLALNDKRRIFINCGSYDKKMKTVIEAEKNYFFGSPLIALKAKQIQIKWTNKHIKLIAFPAAGTETSNNTFKLYKYNMHTQ